MVTPYKQGNQLQDNYNFYHSQLRITVECAFGMLVHRWSILRRALPAAMGLHKITALTMCLCKLHNFLVDEKIAKSLSQEAAQGMIRGNVPLERHQTFPSEVVPTQLLHGGEYFNDVDRNEICRATIPTRNAMPLPREVLLKSVTDQDLIWPTPKTW